MNFFKRNQALIVLLVLGIILLIPAVAFAGFGNSTSYGGGDGGGFGGGGFGIPMFIPLLGGGGGWGGILWIIVIIAMYYFRQKNRQARRQNARSNRSNYPVQEQPADRNLSILRANDPNFSEESFIARINNMYIQLQEAWMKKDWQSIRPFETDALFSVHQKELQALIDTHRTNIIEDIGILDTHIIKYTVDGSNEAIAVYLKARIIDYVIDDNTKKVIEGNKTKEIHIAYSLKMIRRRGVLTKPDAANTHVAQCPNCGANLSINESGKCDYCGSVISSGEYTWVLASLTVLEQN
jgi:predicted lipid-binding transport protein (Tim44 family)